jgi:hypothetical protein
MLIKKYIYLGHAVIHNIGTTKDNSTVAKGLDHSYFAFACTEAHH